MKTLNKTDNLTLFVDTIQKLSMVRDIDSVTKIVRTVARNLTGADGATFVLKDNDLCYYADEDAITPLWKGQRFPMTSCISGWTMLNKQSVVIKDIYQDPRIPIDAYRPTFVKSLVMVPIRTIDPIGAIGNYWAHMHLPTEMDIYLLQSLADITAISIENINIYLDLENRVKQRTIELQSLNKELEAFSYSISHDLKSPLRAIEGYTSILQEDFNSKLGEEGMEISEKIIKSANHMTELINALLDFSKQGRKELEKSKISIYNLVSEICNEAKIKNEKINFILKEIPDTYADLTLIKQVWYNLISNAIKYSSKKSKIIIEIGSVIKDNKSIYYIKDNGVGFDMKYYSKLFGVFQRLHSNEEFEGTGIGLSLVAKIITKHGGEIWADSQPDQGATFYFYH